LHKLETLLESNVDRNFDKFEIYILRGVLNVPEELVPWVKLGHYEGIQSPTASVKLPSAEEVQQLQHRLRQTRKLNAVLDSTARRNNATLEQLRSLVEYPSSGLKTEHPSSGSDASADHRGAYTFLTNGQSAKTLGMTTRSGTQQTDGPLATNTSFALSQLPALRALLDDLRPKLAELGDAQAAATEGHSARERRIYLNNQTRKAVERQGVEIGASAQGLGKRAQGDEVAALESIADGLSAGKANDDRMEE
jgi:kinetochore protein Mis12/MTW1